MSVECNQVTLDRIEEELENITGGRMPSNSTSGSFRTATGAPPEGIYYTERQYKNAVQDIKDTYKSDIADLREELRICKSKSR